MKKATRIWLITAAFLILVGCILFGGIMTMLGWNFTKLSTDKYETNIYEIVESFHNVSINTDTADILFAVSNDGRCVVECYEERNAKHAVAVQNGTLSINVENQKAWYDCIGIFFDSPKITVFLPASEYGNLSIYASTGDITMPEDFKFDNADVSISTGFVKWI